MFEIKDYEILCGNALDKLKDLPDNSVQVCVTSPPYYGLRDYGTGHWVGGDPNCPHQQDAKRQTFHKGYVDTKEKDKQEPFKKICPLCGAVRVDEQIGLEESPEEYIQRLVDVFHEVKRVLKDDGTLWINIGDSYAGGGAKANKGNRGSLGLKGNNVSCCKPKDLIGIPWMLAFALRNDGWYLRQDIIWQKPNPMPESVADRCTKSHEYIFLLSKNSDYYFDHNAMLEEATTNEGRPAKDRILRNKRDVWTVGVNSYKGAHFATYPEKLIEPCILAGSPVDGIVLDPFNGSGTTGVVAMKNDRKYIGVELNPEYVELTKKRFDELEGIEDVSIGTDEEKKKVKKVDLF